MELIHLFNSPTAEERRQVGEGIGLFDDSPTSASGSRSKHTSSDVGPAEPGGGGASKAVAIDTSEAAGVAHALAAAAAAEAAVAARSDLFERDALRGAAAAAVATGKVTPEEDNRRSMVRQRWNAARKRIQTLNAFAGGASSSRDKRRTPSPLPLLKIDVGSGAREHVVVVRARYIAATTQPVVVGPFCAHHTNRPSVGVVQFFIVPCLSTTALLPRCALAMRSLSRHVHRRPERHLAGALGREHAAARADAP